MRKITSFIIFLFSSLVLFADVPYGSFTRYSSENGLPATTVQDIAQDKDGYLWIATWSGLYRFDGKNFINYRAGISEENGDRRQISNRIIDINYDAGGNIIILAYDNSIYRLKHNSEIVERMSPGESTTRQMFKLSSKEFCFVSDSGRIVNMQYQPDKDEYHHTDSYNVQEHATVLHIKKTSDGSVWAMTDAGLYRNGKLFSEHPSFEFTVIGETLYFGSSEGKIIRFEKDSSSVINTGIKSDLRIIKSIPGEEGCLLAGSAESGLFTYELSSGKISSVGEVPFWSGDMICKDDINGNIWLYSRAGGLYWFDKENRRLLPFYNPRRQGGWNNETNITAFYPDRQGNLWIGGSWGGLERVTFIKDMFHIKPLTSTSEVSPGNSVRAICRDKKGILYAATRDNKVHVFNSRMEQISEFSTPGTAYSMTESHDGTLWMGMKPGGLMSVDSDKINDGTLSAKYYRKSDSFYGQSANMVYALRESPDKKLWIGSFDDGLSYLNFNNKSGFFISKRNRLSFPTNKLNSIRTIEFGPDGLMYAGGTIGMFVCDNPDALPEDMKFKWFTNAGNGYDVQDIMFTRSGQLYASTSGSGLLKFDSHQPESGFTQITTVDGLLSNLVLSSIEDFDGNIWIATFGGLNRLTPSTGKIMGYSYERLGLKNMLFNEGEAVMGADSTIYFNTNSGILYFKPREISNSSFTPKIIVNRCLCSGKEVDIESGKDIIMKSDDNMTLRFLAIDMSGQENVTYSYMLEGRDTSWTFLGGQPSVQIPGIKRGNYLLKLRSTNADGIPVMNERAFRIKVGWSTSGIIMIIVFIVMIMGGIIALCVHISKKGAESAEQDSLEEDPLDKLSPEDRNFVLTLHGFLKSNLANSEIDVDSMAETVRMSRSNFFSKCKEILGMTPIEYLRSMRFKKAIELIDSGKYTISQVAFMTGFNDSHYFSRMFRRQFGATPSDYKNRPSGQGGGEA